MSHQQEFISLNKKKKNQPIERNERMTAIAGGLLFVLIIAELLITANLQGMVKEHIFVGILLTGPLVIKMISRGYRFIRYYTKSTDFVKKGPPNVLLRILAPFLVLTTVLVFASGFGLILFHNGLFLKIHAVSVSLWIPLTAVHIYAYIRKVPRLVVKDLTSQAEDRVHGRKWRFIFNMGGLTAGLAAAIVMLPIYAHGGHSTHHGHHVLHLFQDIPSPLALGIKAGMIGIFLAIPLLRFTNKAIS